MTTAAMREREAAERGPRLAVARLMRALDQAGHEARRLLQEHAGARLEMGGRDVLPVLAEEAAGILWALGHALTILRSEGPFRSIAEADRHIAEEHAASERRLGCGRALGDA